MASSSRTHTAANTRKTLQEQAFLVTIQPPQISFHIAFRGAAFSQTKTRRRREAAKNIG
jgi:hypothetical protein